MKFDELLLKIGEFGPFQKRMFILVALVPMVSALITMSPVFLLDIPNYRCAIPWYSNDTYSIQNVHHEELINLTIPLVVDSQGKTRYSQCQLYNLSEMILPDLNRTQLACASWVYDISVIKSSGITDFDLVCEKEILRSHSNMISFAGGFPGALIFGPLADTFGRKKSLLLSVLLTVTTSIIAALSPSYAIYITAVFFNSLASMGLFMLSFVIVMEYVGPSKRTLVGMAIEFFWVFGLLVLNLAAYFFRQWRHLRLVIGVPPVLFLLYWWIVPESPRWLISKGKTEEAFKTLRKIAESNKVELKEEVMESVTLEEEEKTVPIWKIFTSPILLLRISIIAFNWCSINIVYYGLSLNVGNLSGNIYLNFFVSNLMEMLAYVGCFLLLTRMGRKTMLCASQLVGGLACLATIFPVVYGDLSTKWILTALSMVGKLGSSAAFAIIYIFASELLPTVIRQSGIALCSMTGMIGGMVAPYIADLGILLKGPLKDALPPIVFGSLTIVAGLSAIQLPETKDKILPETIDDSIHFGKFKRKKPYLIEHQFKSTKKVATTLI